MFDEANDYVLKKPFYKRIGTYVTIVLSLACLFIGYQIGRPSQEDMEKIEAFDTLITMFSEEEHDHQYIENDTHVD